MNEKIKVTIIATGFKEREKVIIEREVISEKPLIPEDKIKDLVEEKNPQNKFDEMPDTQQEEKEYREPTPKKVIPDVYKSMEEEDYLDIPTFLRKNNQSKY